MYLAQFIQVLRLKKYSEMYLQCTVVLFVLFVISK